MNVDSDLPSVFAVRSDGGAILTASEFRLVAADGTLRGLLNADDGLASLALFDGSGRERIVLRVASDGRPAILLFGREETWRFAIGLDENDEPLFGPPTRTVRPLRDR